jgi:Plant transposon protein
VQQNSGTMSDTLEMDDDLDEMLGIYYHTRNVALYVHDQEMATAQPRASKDHRSQPRRQRRVFRHDQALACIRRDYLGPNRLLGAEFQLMFRISQGRFQVLLEDVMASGNPFYVNDGNRNQQLGASIEAKLLMPLKCLAYGVPAHCFMDYFSMSKTMCLEVTRQFDKVVADLYKAEFLRVPDGVDLKNICMLHKSAHGVDGMVGSLDCSHTYWKNCPKAWQGSFQGKEGRPTVVLEALCDYHLFFWHASCGYAGCLNDINILNMSPFLERLVDGEMDGAAHAAGAAPFTIAGEQFDLLYALVDGIYPRYSRFVQGIKSPIGLRQQQFTGWQEGARKDIERAFGVLKGQFQFVERPIHLHSLIDIGNRMTACLILHNMCRADYVMENEYRKIYNPANTTIDEQSTVIAQPDDMHLYHATVDVNPDMIGINHTNVSALEKLLTRENRFNALQDIEENSRLHRALLRHVAGDDDNLD